MKPGRHYVPQRAPRERRGFRPARLMGTKAVANSLLDQIEGELAASGLSAAAFGRKAVGDPHLVLHLRAGLRLRHATAIRVSGCLGRLSGDS